MRKSTTLIQLQTLHVITQPLRFERSLEETGGLMTMALPFRQKTMVKKGSTRMSLNIAEQEQDSVQIV